jgi:hypothetical protein
MVCAIVYVNIFYGFCCLMVTVEGTIWQSHLERWALMSRQGKEYEIYKGAPQDLLQMGLKVRVKGQVRDDVVSLAGIGPILEVQSFELLES